MWHVDDTRAAFARLKELGAKEYDPITKRGETGFVTASVVDPFGNVLGIMYNPHYVENVAKRSAWTTTADLDGEGRAGARWSLSVLMLFGSAPPAI